MRTLFSVFAKQRRSLRIIEVSSALGALAIAVFSVALLLAPRITEADTIASSAIDPQQLTINVARDLPSFEDRFQRHTGVLDILDGRSSRPAN